MKNWEHLGWPVSFAGHQTPVFGAEEQNKERGWRKERKNTTGNKSVKKKSGPLIFTLLQASWLVLPQAINSNCLEQFTTCTHHTHHPPTPQAAWQQPGGPRPSSSTHTLSSPPVVVPVTNQALSRGGGVGCGALALRAHFLGCNKCNHFLGQIMFRTSMEAVPTVQ